jgi:hypothetical protein
METIDYRGFTVVVFDETADLSRIHEIQNNTEKNNLIYVALEGTDDKYLHPDRFIVKNHDASLMNHFLWEGLFSQEEQTQEMYRMIDNFIETGNPYLIEKYEFVADEPFYDYSGGRE